LALLFALRLFMGGGRGAAWVCTIV
jgi:hypothetical protein